MTNLFKLIKDNAPNPETSTPFAKPLYYIAISVVVGGLVASIGALVCAIASL